jgi:hypothetical protein
LGLPEDASSRVLLTILRRLTQHRRANWSNLLEGEGALRAERGHGGAPPATCTFEESAAPGVGYPARYWGIPLQKDSHCLIENWGQRWPPAGTQPRPPLPGANYRCRVRAAPIGATVRHIGATGFPQSPPLATKTSQTAFTPESRSNRPLPPSACSNSPSVSAIGSSWSVYGVLGGGSCETTPSSRTSFVGVPSENQRAAC